MRPAVRFGRSLGRDRTRSLVGSLHESKEGQMKVHAEAKWWVMEALIFLVLTPLLAAAAPDSGSLTAGTRGGLCRTTPSIPIIDTGYSSIGFGSYTPTGLTGGDTVIDVIDVHNFCSG